MTKFFTFLTIVFLSFTIGCYDSYQEFNEEAPVEETSCEPVQCESDCLIIGAVHGYCGTGPMTPDIICLCLTSE